MKNFIFEYDGNFSRDEETVLALKDLKKTTAVELLSKIISPDSRKMVNVLTFANNHENKTGVKNSFSDLASWKSERAYE